MRQKIYNCRVLINHLDLRSQVKYILFILILIMIVPFSLAQIWEEDTFEDFNDGVLDAAGNNIYVSRDGRICTIHKFDFNNDSYIDLLFCQTHNGLNLIPATLAGIIQKLCFENIKYKHDLVR